MKKLLSLALIAITFFACSKQEENNRNSGRTSLSVNIDFSKFSSRSGEGEITLPLPEWSHLLLVAKNSSGSEIREILVRKADFGSGNIQVFERDSVDFRGGKVEAYIITENSDWGTLTALPTVNLPVLADVQKDINNWQLSGFIKSGVSGKFINVPYYGSGSINDLGPGGDGHYQLSADVSVVPELGRIQVLKTPATGGVKNGNEVTSIEVKTIYINKIVSNDVTIDIRTENGGKDVETGGAWITNFYETGKSLVGMADSGTDKGYQIFNGNTPHVIVEIDYQLNNITGKTYKGYLTITKFTYPGVSKGDLIVARGKIYNIDLSELQPAYDQIGDEPYDNTTYYDLYAVVTVEDWSIIDVTPEL